MINRGATLVGRMAVILAFLFAFTACGGGGGGAGGFLPGGDDAISVTLIGPDGQPTNSITQSEPATVRVQLDGGANIVVRATTNLGSLVPASGSALTNNDGVATFQLEAGTIRGAGTVTVTATVNTANLTGTASFQVGDNGLRLGFFATDGMFVENSVLIEPGSALAAGGNAQLSVVVLDNDDNRITTAEEVRFSSGCIAAGLATINPELPITVNGRASTLYTAVGCTGIDEITATVVGGGTQATGDLTIASPQANAVRFVSAEPTLIVLRGTGGENRSENSDVIFQVVDGNGLPLQGITVNFSLSTSVGGLSLSTNQALSNGDGQVQVTVRSGNVATVARITATIQGSSGETISTLSDLLTVTTGLPDQNSISLSVGDCDGEGTFVVDGGLNTDGLCRELTVRMADKFNNPVVDGTAAVFTTELGAIVGNCTTTNGVCSAQWTSQAPRLPTLTGPNFVNRIDDPDYSCPSHNASAGPCPDDLGFTRGGNSTILVHAIGEESFIDRNGNGLMDEDERNLFDNLPEAFLDDNTDGVYTPALPSCLANPLGSPQCISGQEEIFVDFNNNDIYDQNDTPAVYNGLLCPPEGDGIWCSRELVHVRDSAVIIMGDGINWSVMMVNSFGNPIVTTTDDRTATVYISDIYNNPPPGGASISISANGNCSILSLEQDEADNVAVNGAFAIRVLTNTDISGVNPDPPGTFDVSITSPRGTLTTRFNCGLVNCGFSPQNDDRCPAPP